MTTETKALLTAQIAALETETMRLWQEYSQAREALDKSPLKAQFDAALDQWAEANRQLAGLQTLLNHQP